MISRAPIPLILAASIGCPMGSQPPIEPRCDVGIETCTSSADCAIGLCEVTAGAEDGIGCCVQRPCGRICEGPDECEPGVGGVQCAEEGSVCLFDGSGPGVCNDAAQLASRVSGCELARSVIVSREGEAISLPLKAYDGDGDLVPFIVEAAVAAVSSPLLSAERTTLACDLSPACAAPLVVDIGDASCSGTLLVLSASGTSVVADAGGEPIIGAAVSAIVDGVVQTLVTNEYGLAVFEQPVPAVLVDAPGFRREARAIEGMTDVLIELMPLTPEVVDVEVAPDLSPDAVWFALTGRGQAETFELTSRAVFRGQRTLTSQVDDVPDIVLPANAAQRSGVWQSNTAVEFEDIPPYGRWALSTISIVLTADIVTALTTGPMPGIVGVLPESQLQGLDLRPSRELLKVEAPRQSNTFGVDIPAFTPCATPPCVDHVASLAWLRSDASGFILVGAALFPLASVPQQTPQIAAFGHDGLENADPIQIVVAYSSDQRFETAILSEALDGFPDDRIDFSTLTCGQCDVVIAETVDLRLWVSPTGVANAEALLAAVGGIPDWDRAQAIILLPGNSASALVGTGRASGNLIAGWTATAK